MAIENLISRLLQIAPSPNMILILPILGYLLGALPSAVIITRLLYLPDPRRTGSGNPGATNVLRTGNKPAAALTLAADIGKGAAPVLIAKLLTDAPAVWALTGLFAFLGHLYPVWLKFKGGKGVATAIGVIAALNLTVAVLLIATWLIVALLTRYSSLSALVAAASAPIYFWLADGRWIFVLFAVILAAFLFWRHRANIKRLLTGTESRIGLN